MYLPACVLVCIVCPIINVSRLSEIKFRCFKKPYFRNCYSGTYYLYYLWLIKGKERKWGEFTLRLRINLFTVGCTYKDHTSSALSKLVVATFILCMTLTLTDAWYPEKVKHAYSMLVQHEVCWYICLKSGTYLLLTSQTRDNHVICWRTRKYCKLRLNLSTLRCFHYRHLTLNYGSASHVTTKLEQVMCFVDKQTVAWKTPWLARHALIATYATFKATFLFEQVSARWIFNRHERTRIPLCSLTCLLLIGSVNSRSVYAVTEHENERKERRNFVYCRLEALSFWPTFLILKKINKNRFMRLPCFLCLYILSFQLLNAWAYLYDTWYTYHGTWAHRNGVFHKFFPLVCAPVFVSRCHCGTLQRYRCNECTKQKNCWTRCFLSGSCRSKRV
jgi:hypothetical protein